MGDINEDLRTNSSSCNNFEELLNIYNLTQNLQSYSKPTIQLKTYNLTQIITDPTRITPMSLTLIDVICTSAGLPLTSSGTIDSSRLLDHDDIYGTILKNTDHLTRRYCRNFKAIDMNVFHSGAIDTNWNHIYEVGDVNSRVLLLEGYILSIIERHAHFCYSN